MEPRRQGSSWNAGDLRFDGKPICVPAARQEDYRRAIVAIQARIYRLAMNQQVLIAKTRLSLERDRFQSAGDHQGADDAHRQLLQLEALVAFLSQTHQDQSIQGHQS